MPATVVHAYFAKDVRDILPNEIKAKINEDRVKMFGQSMDPLMFYNLFRPFPGKKIRVFFEYFHKNKTQEYFINLINYIKYNNLSNDTDLTSYLVGNICHYVLDSTIHPFVVYKTGSFNKKYKNTYKYNNVHAFMETFLDNDMIRRREVGNPYRFPIGKFCFNLKPFSSDLKQGLNYCFFKTFNVKNMGKIYFSSLKQMKNAIIIFRKDVFGIKKFIYKTVDTFTSKKTFRFEAISYHYPLDDKHNYLNSEHKLWRNPIDYNITSNESFLDLYLKSLKLAKVLVCASFDYINGKNIELEKVFTNKSYLSGLDCELGEDFKYFEF